METNDVEIRAIECSGSSSGNLFYTCQYRRKGSIRWTTFVKYYPSSAEVDEVISRSPHVFELFSNYSYERCEAHNKKAYAQLEAYKQERQKNKYIKIK